MAHFQWLTREGKQVLLLDFTQHPAKRIEEMAREVQQIITAQPPGSVLVLADFTGATFNTNALSQVAKAALANRRHVARTAWVGVNLPEAQFKALQNLSGRSIRCFATREEGLEFLVEDPPYRLIHRSGPPGQSQQHSHTQLAGPTDAVCRKCSSACARGLQLGCGA